MVKWLSIPRVLGLCMVLVYHFFQELLPGGFIGVDIFFTLSGFLITALIIENYRKTGGFSFLTFLKRRFLRIFPPLLFALLITLPFTLLISTDFIAGIGRQVAAAIGFVTNYFEIITGGSYEDQLLPHLYIHTWTLALEIHFYILWALLFAALSFLLKKRSLVSDQTSADPEKNVTILRLVVFTFSLILAILAYFQMQIVYNQNTVDPSAAYFATQTHGFTFMIGAAAGALFGIRPKEEYPRPALMACLSISGIALSIGIILFWALTIDFNSELTYRFALLCTSFLTTVLIKCAIVLHSVTRKIKEPRILNVVSDLSYCVYLFHWPLYIVFSQIFRNNVLISLITFVLSFVFSAFVFYVLEPIVRVLEKPQIPVFTRNSLKKAFVFSPLLIGLVFSVLVMVRAPEINSLEAEINTAYLYQDADAIIELSQLNLRSKEESTHNDSTTILPSIEIAQVDQRDQTRNSADPQRTGSDAVPPTQVPIVTTERSGVILEGVTIIGDSVCLGARRRLLSDIPNSYVDAEGSRNLVEGYEIIMGLQRQNRLREYVVVSLGTNGHSSFAAMIDRIVADINPGHRLIFVTPFNGRAVSTWSSYRTTGYMRSLPERFPFVTIADWNAAIGPNVHLMGSDQIHIGGNVQAIDIFVNCIIDAISVAGEKPAK